MKPSSKIFSVLVVAFVIAAILRVFVVEAFIVIGDSMSPTIRNGEYVFINRMAYVFSAPERGDIVIAKTRGGDKVIKRVAGLPGDRHLTADGRGGATTTRTNIDPKEYFLLGDNAELSIDSREVGPVDHWDIKGRVIGTFDIKTFRFRKF